MVEKILRNQGFTLDMATQAEKDATFSMLEEHLW